MAGLDAEKFRFLSLDVRRTSVLEHVEAPGLCAGHCLGNCWLLLHNFLFATFASFASLTYGGTLRRLGLGSGCWSPKSREVHDAIHID